MLFSNLGSCQTMHINLFTERITIFQVHNESKGELTEKMVRIILLCFLWVFDWLFFFFLVTVNFVR